MANNVTIPATGTGDATPPVATEQVAGTLEHKQIVELGIPGTGRTLVPADAANGLDVDVTRVSGVVQVGDNAASLTVDPNTGTVWDVSDRAARLVGVVSGGANVFHIDDNAGLISVDDGAGTLTVDAPVGTPVFVRLSDGAAALVGQKAMAASLPVVVASDQSSVPTKETPATLVGTTISAANTGVTLTLGAAGVGLFHYLTSVEIVVTNPTITAVAAAATNLAWTSTNLGGLAWNAGTLLAAGAEKLIARMPLGPPLKSAVANTASTIVAPACGTGTLCRIQATYYTAA